MVHIKSHDEIERIFEASIIVAEAHDVVQRMIEPGISTEELDAAAESHIRKRGATPNFKGYQGFPATICASINDQVVHGIPSKKSILKEGDIIGVDMGALFNGWHGDSARTHEVGKCSKLAIKLSKITRDSLYKAIDVMIPGKRLGDIGYAVQSYVESHGFSSVRQFVGHGIGQALHEDPQVPNYGKAGTGLRLQEGMVLAIEPMINAGHYDVKVLDDGWTVLTADGSLSAHWEHVIAITSNGPRILTEIP